MKALRRVAGELAVGVLIFAGCFVIALGAGVL